MNQTKLFLVPVITCLVILTSYVHNIQALEEDKDFWYRSGKEALLKAQAKRRIEGKAKNVILFVGDGMGVITHTLARIYKGQKNGKTGEEEKLEWENFPFSGLIKTYNTDYQVPDSAGTATALMSGVKTSLGVLGVDSRIQQNQCDARKLRQATIPSMKDWAKSKGKKVGIVTTARLTHATPGAVYAHTPSRDWERDTDIPDKFKGCVKDIATQLVDSLLNKDVDFAMGGGASKFVSGNKTGGREDKDLLKELEKNNVKVIRNTSQLREWDTKSSMIGVFGNSHMDYEALRNRKGTGQPSLEEMTRQALNALTKHQEGYFLMVEAGRIDHAHHTNQAKLALEEALQLEKAVQVARDMTSELDTLIMVTADHSHAVTMSGYPKRGNDVLGYVYDTEDREQHRFMMDKENKTQPYQTISYANGPGFNQHFDKETRDWKNISQMDTDSLEYMQPATFFLPYETHGGEDVSVFARGPQAHHVTGLHEQSFLGALMAHAACVNQDQFGCPATGGASEQGLRAVSLLWISIFYIIQTKIIF